MPAEGAFIKMYLQSRIQDSCMYAPMPLPPPTWLTLAPLPSSTPRPASTICRRSRGSLADTTHTCRSCCRICCRQTRSTPLAGCILWRTARVKQAGSLPAGFTSWQESDSNMKTIFPSKQNIMITTITINNI